MTEVFDDDHTCGVGSMLGATSCPWAPSTRAFRIPVHPLTSQPHCRGARRRPSS